MHRVFFEPTVSIYSPRACLGGIVNAPMCVLLGGVHQVETVEGGMWTLPAESSPSRAKVNLTPRRQHPRDLMTEFSGQFPK